MSQGRRPLSEERLNAYVDGELSGPEVGELIEAIAHDPELKRQVCELRLLKDMLRTSYRAPVVSPAQNPTRPRPRQALAAVVLLAVGLSLGWLGRGWLVPEAGWAQAVRLDPDRGDPGRVVLHLDGSRQDGMRQAVDRAERLLRQAAAHGQALRLELVANSQGLDLFRAGRSSEAKRLAELRRQYPNLVLVGCGQTIRRLRERGEDVRLLPGVEVAPAALDRIVERLHAGWVYLKV